MTPCLYLAVTPCPEADNIPALADRIAETLSPCEENKAYVSALCRGPARVSAQRLGALSLLLSLMGQADIPMSRIVLHRDENGRPFALLRDSDLQFDFNLTHTEHAVGCVLWTGDRRVGIDMEGAPDALRIKKICDRYFSDAERALIPHTDDAGAFLRIWTAKEAIAKQNGHGNPTVFDATAVPDGYRLVYGRVAFAETLICLCVPAEAEIPAVYGVDWT
jgi:phosphopantetheinyl transferase